MKLHVSVEEASITAPLLNEDALAAMIRLHGKRLQNFIRRRVGNPSDVEDLAQETCLEAFRCLSQYKGQSRPETWLFGIALNLVRSYYKRAQSMIETEDGDGDTTDIASSSEDPAYVVENRQRLLRVRVAVDCLSEESIAVLILVFDEQLTYEQAATVLHIPIGTVRSRVSRARAMLKEIDQS
jgi:RNA polymerase sigma factor (sigma-70 family)